MKSWSWTNDPRLLAVLAMALAVLVVGVARTLAPPAQVEGRASVIDGDSLRVGAHEVRLVGIDAPEGRQTCRRDGNDWPCGEAARRELRDLVRHATVRCQVQERDKFERLLATCTVSGVNLNQTMVSGGWALAFGSYQREEADARQHRRGLWSGEFERPNAWRRRNNVGG